MHFRSHHVSSTLALVLSALLVGAVGCRSKSTEAQKPTPSLVCVEPRHDFGTRFESERLSHVFSLQNRGKAPLRLLSVEKSYGCTAVAPPTVIAAGGHAKLEIACDVSKRPGRMADEVVVRTNDPGFPALKLELAAEIKPQLAFEPTEALLEPAFGETQVRDLRLVGKLAPSARLTLIESDDPTPRIELLPPSAQEPARLRITLKAERVETRIAHLRIGTALEEPKELSVLVTWRIASSLDVEPSNPYFNLREAPPHERTLRVRSLRKGLQVHAVEVIEGPFRATLEPDPEGGAYSVRVRVLDDKVPEGERGALGKLLIASNDPAEPKKLVPLFALGVMARQ
jgi:hypothetical protein